MTYCGRCGFRPAEYERRCSWCGRDIDLCAEDREQTFLCDRCFRNQNALGKDEAKAIANAWDRGRWARRRRAWAGWRTRRGAPPRGQLRLWPKEKRDGIPRSGDVRGSADASRAAPQSGRA
jgi:hypothetical protein